MSTLEQAIKLREDGSLKEANKILLDLVGQYPEDSQINYQCAWSFDVMGLEKEAVPYYEKAIKLGLTNEDLKEAYLGLGSTYRTIGEYQKSKELLTKGIQLFNDNALKVFYAMTLFNLNEHSEAMKVLLKIIAQTSSDESIKSYNKAISYYSDKLDNLWI